jgi:hypothetical protein
MKTLSNKEVITMVLKALSLTFKTKTLKKLAVALPPPKIPNLKMEKHSTLMVSLTSLRKRKVIKLT